MILQTLDITNFRNLRGKFKFKKGINVIVAPNGAGKTNLLEALGFISFGSSFRTNSEFSTIRYSVIDSEGLVFTRLAAVLVDGLGNEVLREVIIEPTSNSDSKGSRKVLKADKNRIPLARFMRDFHTVIFSPNTIDVVTGAPSSRRKDLDDFLQIFDEEYLEEFLEYRKVIRGRNKLLEKLQSGLGNKQELDFWNKKLIDLGARIIWKRLGIITKANPIVAAFASDLFNDNGGDLEIEYMSKFIASSRFADIKKALAKKISENIQKEIGAGVSLYGPHREDFRFLLNGRDLREFGSRGQQRLSAFLCKVSQWQILKEKFGMPPLLLLDDLFSELDKKVCDNVQAFLNNCEGQIVITALKRSELAREFLKRAYEVVL